MNTFGAVAEAVTIPPELFPQPSSFSAPFWEATRDQRLVVQRCDQTGRHQFFPRPYSIFTGGSVSWQEVSGNGIVFSHTIIRRALPPFQGTEPFCIVMVELNEGVVIVSRLVRCAPVAIHIGMPVKVCWFPLPTGQHLPFFEPLNPDPSV